MRRVVITGSGVISPLGNSVEDLMAGLAAEESSVRFMDHWSEYKGLGSLVAAPAILENEREIPRQSRRTMGRLSIFAVQSARQAVAESGVTDELMRSGRMGCVFGSTMGSAGSINDTFEIMLPDKNLNLLNSTKFFQSVSHTASMNVSQCLGVNGVVMATSSACASGLQALGTAFDLIRCGRQDIVLCGGAEELHPTVTGSFDILYATSTKYNDTPKQTPRPFDKDRDGLVCGEGAGTLVLEEYEHAQARGVKIIAEVIGYNTCGSGSHVSQSSSDAIERCLRGVLAESGLKPADVDYVNAHATATLNGDAEEAKAIAAIFGDKVPVSSLKGYMGHTLGASGPIELIASLGMMQEGVVYPTLNLENIDPACTGVQHVQERLERPIDVVVKNSFAFGGINASVACRRI